jgi:hypothetical protein
MRTGLKQLLEEHAVAQISHLVFHLPLALPNVSCISMSSTPHTTSTSSNFEYLFNAALDKYAKRTGQDLRDHPLATIINLCESPDSILTIFQEQSRAFDEFRNGDLKLIKWLTPVVNTLHDISTIPALSTGASLVSPTE